jgi:hypothetical protein
MAPNPYLTSAPLEMSMAATVRRREFGTVGGQQCEQNEERAAPDAIEAMRGER